MNRNPVKKGDKLKIYVDSTETLLWNRTFHNWDIDRCFEPHCLVQTQDNGFAIAGYTYNSTHSNLF